MTAGPLRSLRHVADVISVLVWRDQKSRYKSTGMGVVWAIASPVLFLLTFYLLFRVVLPLNIPNYASHLFIGLVFAVFGTGETLPVVLSTALFGALFGLIWALVGYAATRGRRDFTSVSQVVATKYEVLVEHKLAQRGRELLAQMPGGPSPYTG